MTLKTAWKIGHEIKTRIAKQEPQFIIEGTVQIDEMYLSHMGFKKQEKSLKIKHWLLVFMKK